jgi:glycogen operon protein
MRIGEGAPHPLGATSDGKGTNFALFSAHAQKVELCLFDKSGRHELERIALPECTDDVWHGYTPNVFPGQVYGYRVHGPYEPDAGHRFNPHKLLIDPYSKRFAGHLIWSDAHLGYRAGHKREDLSFDRRDNARVMLKSVVVDDAFTWGDDRHPRVPWEETFIYEAHVKGLTKLRGDVPLAARGLFNGLAAPGMIDHLKALGVTAIELLPIQSFVDDRHLTAKGLKNYWGYNPLSFFAPEPRYLDDGSANTFRSTVSMLHAAGIEVILDVVYNHTAEGNHLGPTLCYRGIDNASYYWLLPDTPRYYDDFTGCGNALKLMHPRVLQLVMDSLRYWVESFHVDGFRFDLTSTLGRGPNGFDPNAPFFAAITQDPVLSNVKLIAEPWDLGLGGYQVGAYPTGWSEWNDVFRRTIRRFWRGDAGLIGDVADCMTGSATLFHHDGRGPRASINYVTVHDGFTLADLVSYESKHNEANGEDNRDGGDHNDSSNCGVEGPSDDPEVLDLRLRLRRNLIASTMLALGTPLLLAGDEVANSQNGNNNAYCQDNEIGWVNWDAAGSPADLTPLIGELARLRHNFPQLRRRHWLQGRLHDSYDVKWLRPDGGEMTEDDWNFPESRFLAYVLAPHAETEQPIMIVLNGAELEIDFVLPDWPNTHQWVCILDTTSSAPAQITSIPTDTKWVAAARSVTVFAGVL